MDLCLEAAGFKPQLGGRSVKQANLQQKLVVHRIAELDVTPLPSQSGQQVCTRLGTSRWVTTKMAVERRM